MVKKLGSVRDIAQQVGVSVATVSRALNNKPNVNPETRAKILAAINEAGYSPKMGRRETNVIGLVYPHHQVETGYGDFESAMLAGILQGTAEHRFDIKIISLDRDKLPNETYTQFFMRKGLRGVVLRTFESSRHVCEAIANEGFPHIVIADHFKMPGMNFICGDSKPSVKRAIQYLTQLGHRRIGLCVHRVLDSDHLERIEGYDEGMVEAGIEPDPELKVQVFANMAGGAAAVNSLLSLKDPATAVFFTNPISTLGALRRCNEIGVRVPEELSIVGFDDSDIRRHVFPACTAVCQDARALGYEAALWLTRHLTGNADGTCRRVIPTVFEINETTTVPPGEPARILTDGRRVEATAGGE